MIWTAETRTGLIGLLVRLLEIPVQWRGEPQQVVGGASATVDVLGELGLGVDEITYTEGPTPEAPTEVTPTVYGLREATFQVSVWSPSQRLDQSARMYTSRLRTRMRWPSTLEELRALGLGVVSIGESIPVDAEQSSRLRSGSAVELVLSFGVAEEDASVPFIERARVYTGGDGEDLLTNAGGTALPPSIQQDTTVPPEP